MITFTDILKLPIFAAHTLVKQDFTIQTVPFLTRGAMEYVLIFIHYGCVSTPNGKTSLETSDAI